jgi:hypothetical protein
LKNAAQNTACTGTPPATKASYLTTSILMEY